jgi:hypothetical protein
MPTPVLDPAATVYQVAGMQAFSRWKPTGSTSMSVLQLMAANDWKLRTSTGSTQ